MESYTNLFIAFAGGVCFHAMWAYLVTMGYSLVMMRTTINDSIILLAKNIQSVYEINHIKEEAWKLAERDEKYIEFQKTIDEREIKSLKSTCIRNFINAIPPKYNHLVKFHDWSSAMNYIDKIIKEGK